MPTSRAAGAHRPHGSKAGAARLVHVTDRSANSRTPLLALRYPCCITLQTGRPAKRSPGTQAGQAGGKALSKPRATHPIPHRPRVVPRPKTQNHQQFPGRTPEFYTPPSGPAGFPRTRRCRACARWARTMLHRSARAPTCSIMSLMRHPKALVLLDSRGLLRRSIEAKHKIMCRQAVLRCTNAFDPTPLSWLVSIILHACA